MLLEVDKDSKICLYCAVLSFPLPVYLRLKYNRKFSLDTKEVAEQRSELGHKNRFAVTDNGVGKL